jgi:uroporphyrinogen-III synthase
LVTRPQPEAERTAARLRARGHEVLLLPLLRI